MVQRPLEIKYKDLKEIVNINISYDNLPFKINHDYIRLNEEQVLVPITLEVRNKDLTFEKQGEVHVAKVNVYGIVTSLTNRIITEFEDDMLASFQAEFLQRGLSGRSLYQKIVPIDRKMRYKVDVVVKDVNSGNVGVIRTAIVPPAYDEKELSISSVILSDYIMPLQEVPDHDEMFVLGDVKIRPSLGKRFPANGALGVYLQIYNAGVDQTTLTPSLQVSYKILKKGRVVDTRTDESGEGIQFFSGQRVVLIKRLPLDRLGPGKYQVVVEIQDRISEQSVTARDEFELTAPLELSQGR
jgi:hypothetical protein